MILFVIDFTLRTGYRELRHVSTQNAHQLAHNILLCKYNQVSF